jgi:hypothetical protein
MAALFKTVFVFCLIPIGNDVLCVGHCPFSAETLTQINVVRVTCDGAVAELVGIEGGVVSGVINLESSGVEASDWRLRHDQAYHEA